MSVTFCWEIVKPGKAKNFSGGTSSDIAPLRNTFGQEIGYGDIPKLRAMHAATHLNSSLWLEIAEVLERLDDEEAKLRVWTEF